MTDYCDTCKIHKEELSRIQAVQNRLLQSGSASVGDLQHLQTEKERCEKKMKTHREHAEKSREVYRQMTNKCSEEWKKISSYLDKPHLTNEERSDLRVLQHCFTLAISADYQQAKLILFWRESEQPGSTYYLQEVSIDIFGIIDHRDNRGHIHVFEEHISPKNTDHILSLLTHYWECVADVYP